MPGQANGQVELLEGYAGQTRIELVSESQIPLYFQLARILQRFIRETEIDVGEQFPSEEVIDRQIREATPDIAKELHVETGAPVLFIRRLRVLHEHPLCLCDSFLPATRFPGLGEEPLVRGSLYATLEETYNCSLQRSVRWVEASEVVEREVADLLDISLLSPILLLSGVTYAMEDDVPIEAIRSRFREGISLVNTVMRDALRRRAPKGPNGDAPPADQTRNSHRTVDRLE